MVSFAEQQRAFAAQLAEQQCATMQQLAQERELRTSEFGLLTEQIGVLHSASPIEGVQTRKARCPELSSLSRTRRSYY